MLIAAIQYVQFQWQIRVMYVKKLCICELTVFNNYSTKAFSSIYIAETCLIRYKQNIAMNQQQDISHHCNFGPPRVETNRAQPIIPTE